MAYMERERSQAIHKQKLAAIKQRKKGVGIDTLDNLPPKTSMMKHLAVNKKRQQQEQGP